MNCTLNPSADIRKPFRKLEQHSSKTFISFCNRADTLRSSQLKKDETRQTGEQISPMLEPDGSDQNFHLPHSVRLSARHKVVINCGNPPTCLTARIGAGCYKILALKNFTTTTKGNLFANGVFSERRVG